MKKLLICLAVIAASAFAPAANSLTKEEREKATQFLTTTKDGIADAIKDLSDAQLKFKPAPDKWSIEDCVKHIAVTENMLWQMTEGNIKAPLNPDKRTDIKWSDDDVMNNIADRTNKVKTSAPMEPQNSGFATLDDALKSFNENRGKLIDYVNSTSEDLRNHVAALPFGSFDCYQMILFIGAHSKRHTAQIAEVKADPGFPKN